MKYRVVWTNRAHGSYTLGAFIAHELGIGFAPFEAAFRNIERTLATDPVTAGESRQDPERVLIELPLAVHYEVFEDHKLVLIYFCNCSRR